MSTNIEDLANELKLYKAAAPLCEAHQPNGGARAQCLVCGLIELNSSLSQISYLCGEPNEMEVSEYDDDFNELEVVKQVERLVEELKRLKDDYPGGDKEAQALAWSAVYQACVKAGMLSFVGSKILGSGRERVIEFIEHLAEKAKETK